MQSEKVNEYLLLSVPLDMLAEAGISEESVIQMSATEGKIVIEAVADFGDFVCDGDCESCPVNGTECDDDCEHCPCAYKCDESEVN